MVQFIELSEFPAGERRVMTGTQGCRVFVVRLRVLEKEVEYKKDKEEGCENERKGSHEKKAPL